MACVAWQKPDVEIAMKSASLLIIRMIYHGVFDMTRKKIRNDISKAILFYKALNFCYFFFKKKVKEEFVNGYL